MKILFIKSGSLVSDSRAQKELRALNTDGACISAYTWNRNEDNSDSEFSFIDESFVYSRKAEDGGGIKNLLALVLFIFKIFCFLVKNGDQYDVIHCVNFDMALPCFLAKCVLLRKYKIVYDVYDFYVDSYPVPMIIKGLIRELDIHIMNYVDLVILAIDSRINQIKPARPKKSIIVYNTPEEVTFNSKNEVNNRHSKLKIVFVGALQNDRFLDELVRAATDLPFIELVVGGFGQEKYERLMRKSKVTNYLGRLDYTDTLEVEADADLLVAMYNPKIPNHKYSAPNKLFEAMMLGKPIIIADGMGLNSIINDANCGFVVKYNFDSFCALLKQIFGRMENLQELGKNAKQMYENKYSWKTNSSVLIDAYHEL
jgi:glycosyltransferase involved in cell wall biosynthesis